MAGESGAGETSVQAWFTVASRWAGIAGAAAVLLVFWHLFKRQKPEPVPVEVLSFTPEMAAQRVPNAGSVTPELLNELIRQKPANVSLTLRDWVAGSTHPASKN
jgi:flagellar M-ring protein FliF